jgi:hypothetical protein
MTYMTVLKQVVQYFVEICGFIMKIGKLSMGRLAHLRNLWICHNGMGPRFALCGLRCIDIRYKYNNQEIRQMVERAQPSQIIIQQESLALCKSVIILCALVTC